MDAAGIIVAGGKSARFKGNKALVEISSQRMIDVVVSRLKNIFPKLILVTNTPEDYPGLDVEIVSDLIPGRGPLSGIHAGLVRSSYSLNFIVACDMPFVSGALGAYLVQQAAPDDDIIVPFVNGFNEPLSAVYRRTCIPFIEASLLSGQSKVTDFYQKVRVKRIHEEEITAFGVDACFFNINTREDLKKVFSIIANQ